MPVKVVTGSVSDISPPIAAGLGITVVPLNVVFGSEIYRDGIDPTTEQFYQRLERSQTLPTTSTPPIQAFIELYDKLAEETDEILVITISRRLSATGEAALKAVESMEKKCRVEIVDSQFAMMGEGLLVIAAAKAAQAGARLDELAVEDATTPNETDAFVERLDARFPKEKIYRSKVSPVIGTNVGPRVIGVAVPGDR